MLWTLFTTLLSVNIEKKMQKWERVSQTIIEVFRKIDPPLASDKFRKVL